MCVDILATAVTAPAVVGVRSAQWLMSETPKGAAGQLTHQLCADIQVESLSLSLSDQDISPPTKTVA